MQRDIELIFPIKDVASAALMTIKADCLHKAGIINEAEKQHVHSRARTFLDDATLKDAAESNLTENKRRFPPPWTGGVIYQLISAPIIGLWIDIDWPHNGRRRNPIALGSHALSVHGVISRLQ
jgi:hypothetical protein